jgi:thiamine-phosphate pyrophosphorylase
MRDRRGVSPRGRRERRSRALDPAAADPPTIDPQEAGCQIFLISPPGLDPTALAPALDAALGAGGVAAFVLRPSEAAPVAIELAAAQLRPVCAAHGVAFLLQDDARLALEIGADGVHLGPGRRAETAAARALLGPQRILGAACGLSRDAAMLAGEHGADYIGLGDPERAVNARLIELVGWWSGLFVLPCLVEGMLDADDCAALSRAGADFVGVARAVFEHAGGPVAGLDAIRQAIARP